MPISMYKKGETASVREVLGTDEVARYLNRMGFVKGERVRVVSRLFGSVIIDVKGSRIALDESMAKRIVVS